MNAVDSAVLPHECQIFDRLAEGVQILDQELRYLYLNNSAVAHSGKQHVELVGHRMVDVYPGIQDTWVFKAITNALNSGEAARTTNDFTYPDGSTRYFQLRIEPLPIGVIIFSYDISPEQAHLIHMESLAAMTLENDRQFYALARKLRSPLRVCRGNLSLMKDCSAYADTDSDQSCLQDALSSLDQMLALVDALTLHASLGSSSPPLHVDTALLVQHACDELRQIIPTGARIETHGLPHIEAYPDELSTLFACLIRNAIEARPSHLPLHIQISATHTAPCWEFTVRDNGIGIPPEHLRQVFDMFYKVPRPQSAGHVGAGLAHCQRIVKLHGGSIWFDSSSNTGSVLRFSLYPPLPITTHQ